MQTNETKVVPRPPPRRARQNGPSVYAKASRLLEEKAKKDSRPYQTLEPLVKEDGYRGTGQRPHTGASPARSGPSSKGRSVRRDIMAPLTPKTSSTKRHAGPAAHRRNGVKQTKIHNAKAHSVGNYLIEETIGEGTFGKVKRGMHSATKETVAIKILEKSKIKTEADLTRVTREITILKKTRHENCIRLLEVIDTPQQIFLMMEFLDGGEVFDHIVRKTRLSEPDASDLFIQILDGVEYLHNSGVIHRDLKPENLLMQRLGNGTYRIKVADFGLSNLSDGQQLLKTACGSPCYAAPEMIAGKHYDGTKSDVWSLGVVLFALLCGYLPFEDDDTSELYRKILSASYECPSFVSFQGQNLLARMLNTNPLTRLSIQAVKGHRWMQQNASAYRSETLTPCTDNLAPEHHKIVMQTLLELGFDSAAVEKSLAAKSHNNNTAAYYLIAQKMHRTGQFQPPQPASRVLTSEQTLKTSKSKPAAAQIPSLEVESTPAPDNSEGTSNALDTTNTTWEATQSAKTEAEASGVKLQTKQMSDSEEEETKQDSEDEAKDKNKNEDEDENENEIEIENGMTSARGQQVKQPRKESGVEDQKDLLLPILTATDYLANPFKRPGDQDLGEVKTMATSEHHPISDEAEMAVDVITKDTTPLARPVEACTRMDLNGATSPAASAEAVASVASKASSDNLLSPDKQLDMRRLSITADDTTESKPIPTGPKVRTGNLSSPPALALGTESKKQRVAEEPEKEQTQHQESDSPANECSNDEKAGDEGEQHQLLDQAKSNSKHPEDPTFSGPENGEFSDALELEQALVLPQTKDTANQLRKPGMAIMKPFGPTSIQNPFMRPERPRVGPVLPHRARFRMSSRRTSA